MTIEHHIQRHVERIALLAQFLRTAYLGTRSKERPVARKVRRQLIMLIEQMIDYEQEMLDADRSYLENTTEAERAADDKVDPDFFTYADAFAEDFSLMPLLDAARIISAGEAFDLTTGTSFIVDEGYPVHIPVTSEELGQLANLIASMTHELGVSFTIERVFRDEDALFIFVVGQAERAAAGA
jgi:hypothetical protein